MIGIGTHIRSARQRDLYQLPLTGQASGTNGTIVFVATQDLVVTANGAAAIVSETKANEGSGRRHTIVFSCTAGQSGNIIIRGASKIIKLGSEVTTAADFYTGTNATAPILTFNLNKLPNNLTVIRQTTAYTNILPTSGTSALPTGLTYLNLAGSNIAWTYTGALPTGLTYLNLAGTNIAWTYTGALPTGLTLLYLSGNSIAWTYSGALPTGLTYLVLSGNSIAWTYSGALPTGLTYLNLAGSNIAWTYTGALPTGLTYLRLDGTSIAWTYTGALPTGLTLLYLSGNSIAWTYSGALPTGLTYLYLAGSSMDWTGNTIGRPTGTPKPNMTTINLLNYRLTVLMDYADLIVLLNCLLNNVGTVSSTISIREQITDNVTAIAAATPSATPANTAEHARYLIDTIKSTKSVSTFNLNTTAI